MIRLVLLVVIVAGLTAVFSDVAISVTIETLDGFLLECRAIL